MLATCPGRNRIGEMSPDRKRGRRSFGGCCQTVHCSHPENWQKLNSRVKPYTLSLLDLRILLPIAWPIARKVQSRTGRCAAPSASIALPVATSCLQIEIEAGYRQCQGQRWENSEA